MATSPMKPGMCQQVLGKAFITVWLFIHGPKVQSEEYRTVGAARRAARHLYHTLTLTL